MLSRTCSCRTRRSVFSWRLLLGVMQRASLIMLWWLSIATGTNVVNVLLGAPVSRWRLQAMVTVLGRVALIVLRWRLGRSVRRMSRRTPFDFAGGEFFQVGDAWLKAFYTLFLASNRMACVSDTRSLTARLLRWVATRWAPSWLLQVLLWLLGSTSLRAPCHGEVVCRIIVFWIVHI
jgi:hypothetical protein